MPLSRKIWGWFVFCLGLLWVVGGIAAIPQGDWHGWLYAIMGVGLIRLGYNLKTPNQQG